MNALALAVVAVTMYIPHTDVLYCGGLVSEQVRPWVAMPVGGPWKCGEEIAIWYEDGEIEFYVIADGGPFINNCVMQVDGECLPIAFDVASPWWHRPGISARAVKVWSVTAKKLELEERAGR